jgi:lipoate-protein ligase A
MAVDEAMLTRYVNASEPTPPTLRLYGFTPATLSLGRNQDASSAHQPEFLRARAIGMVRRPTGGGAVLHHRERTYSIIGRLRTTPFYGGVVETYRTIAEALVLALAALGAAPRLEPAAAHGSGRGEPRETACFRVVSSHEITSGGRKLVGSAQLRRRGAFLQHGSLPLSSDDELFAAATGAAAPGGAAIDLATATGRLVTAGQVDEALVGGFERRFGATLAPGAMTDGERLLATRLYSWKYCSTAWTFDGKLGERESARVDFRSEEPLSA